MGKGNMKTHTQSQIGSTNLNDPFDAPHPMLHNKNMWIIWMQGLKFLSNLLHAGIVIRSQLLGNNFIWSTLVAYYSSGIT